MTSKSWASRRVGPALVGIAALALASCGGGTDEEPRLTETVTVQPTAPTATTQSGPTGSPSVVELSWEEVMAQVRPAVAQISVGTCEGPVTGSGFFIDGRHVVTAAHVVAGAAQVSIQTDSETALPAVVLDADPAYDVALLRTTPQAGLSPLPLASDEPRQASELAVIGFPLGMRTPQISNGLVSGSSDAIDYGDQVVESVFTTNASTNVGNSGGPVVNRSGVVIGLVSGGVEWDSADDDRRPVDGVNFIVPAASFAPLLHEWSFTPSRVTSECPGDRAAKDGALPSESPGEDEGDPESFPVEVRSDHELAYQFGVILHTHGMAINNAQYGTAWSYFTPGQQEKLGGLASWSDDLASSYWEALLISGVEDTSPTTATVSTQLRTEDYTGRGEWTCTVFTLDYEFVRDTGPWLIDRARSTSSPEECVPRRG